MLDDTTVDHAKAKVKTVRSVSWQRLLIMRNSHPMAFKSRLYIERYGWDADIKVDIDDHKNPFRISNLRVTAKWLKSRSYLIKRVVGYKTGRGSHIRIWFVAGSSDTGGIDVPPYTVLRVQAMLGDDPVRQRFNMRRVRRHEDGWNVLWTEKWRNGELVSKETIDPVLTRTLERVLQ